MPRDHHGLEVLTHDECVNRVATHELHVGRVAFEDNGLTLVLPVNYRWVDDSVVFVTGPGTKLAAAARGQWATFEVDAVDAAWQEGWSVLFHGPLEEVTDASELERLEQLPLRSWGRGGEPHYLRLRPEHVSGRAI